MKNYDAIIVGAGPAGSTLARLLPKDWKILLIDGRVPGGKPCGGLLAPDAQKALARFDLTLPKAVLVDPQIFSVKTIDVATGLVRWYPRTYLNVNRDAFDSWLIGLLGDNVQVLRGRCARVERRDGGYCAHILEGGQQWSACAPVLVGADGAASVVRRCLYPALRTRRYVAIQQWFGAGAAAVNPFYSCIFDPLATDCCSWSIHKDGMLIFGGAFPAKGCRAAFEAHKKRLKRFGFDLEKPVRTEACVVLRPTGPRSFETGRQGAYLVGEAAGFISPSSLEGISSAMLSAEALAGSLRKEDPARAYRRATGKLRVKLLMKKLKCPFMYVPVLRRLVMRSGLTALRVVPR